ncbi:MAG TPA: hypothetical protein VKY37_07650 [Brumimicrobium sp.]|nr:hypothetical protein [Brumimicrobium sp.]
MKITSKHFNNEASEGYSYIESLFDQAVIISFNEIKEIEEVHELIYKLEHIINQNNLGEYDGHETACDNSHGFLYMYGPSAEKLFKGVKTTLEEASFLNGAQARLIFGPLKDGVKEITLDI